MRKLQVFFRSFFRSLADPTYYRDVLKARAAFSWKYFFFLNFLLGFLSWVFIVPPLLAFQPENVADQITSVYPSDLVISIENQRLSINQELPYQIPFPYSDDLEKELGPDASRMSLVTFTSDEEFGGIQDFERFQSIAVVTESALYVLKDTDTGEVRAYPIMETEAPVTIDAQLVSSFKEKILELPAIKNRWYIPIIALGVLILVWPATIAWRLLTLVFYSLVMWIIGMIFWSKRKLSFEQWYKLGLHALTLPIIVATITDWMGYSFLHGWTYLLGYVVWASLIGWSIQNEVTSQKNTAPVKTTRKTHA